MQYNDMSKEELLALKESLNKEYAEAKAKGLALDMSQQGRKSFERFCVRKRICERTCYGEPLHRGQPLLSGKGIQAGRIPFRP